MPKPTVSQLITPSQRASLAWLNKQVDNGNLSRPAIEEAVGLSQSNVWAYLGGHRVIASKGLKALVAYADKLRGGKALPPKPDPFDELRLIAKNSSPKNRDSLLRIVVSLVEVYSWRYRRFRAK